jgi:hypothetical protein
MAIASSTEMSRQYKVLQQMLSMHAALRDRYGRRARAAKIVLLGCSVAFTATTFASDTFFTTFRLPPDIVRVTLGVAAVIAFFLSLLLLVVDWESLAAGHRDAVIAWSRVLAQFRETRSEDGTWPEERRQELSSLYWEVTRNTSSIPDREFNGLKGRYLRKVAVSKLLDRFPACPAPIILLFLIFRDIVRATKGVHNNGGSSPADQEHGKSDDARKNPEKQADRRLHDC